MGKCKNCCYWEKDSDTQGKCKLASSKNGMANYGEPLATAYDAESYSAYLETNAEYGCVQFKSAKQMGVIVMSNSNKLSTRQLVREFIAVSDDKPITKHILKRALIEALAINYMRLKQRNSIVDSYFILLGENASLQIARKTLQDRIDYALANCPVCSPKPGSPTLCKVCAVLQSGINQKGENYYE